MWLRSDASPVWSAREQSSKATGQQGNRATGQQGNRATRQQGNKATGQQGNRSTRQQVNKATGQQGRQQGGRPRCHSGCFFAASDVLQDITRRILHYYCDRRCTMPSACCSAPSRCNVLPAALIFCFEMSAHNSASLLCDVCRLLYIAAMRCAANGKLQRIFPACRANCRS